jgi:hypothetical protein
VPPPPRHPRRLRVGDAQLGYRFELVPDHNNNITGSGVCVAESGIPVARGGRFAIDLTTVGSPGGAAAS